MRVGGSGAAFLLAAILLAAAVLPAEGAPPANESRAEEPGLSPVRDLGGAARAFLGDGARIAASPFRVSRGDAARLGGIAAVTALLYANDEAILDWFHKNEDAPPLEPAIDAGRRIERVGLMGETLKYYYAALPVAYFLRLEKPTAALAQLIVSHEIAGLFKNLAARSIGRSRPWEGRGPYHFQYMESTSFPSGHASTIFQVATILSHHVGRAPASVLFYGLATSVCLQRLESHSHWPSDVFAGAVYGYAVARAVIRFHEERREERSARLLPYIDPERGAVGVLLARRF